MRKKLEFSLFVVTPAQLLKLNFNAKNASLTSRGKKKLCCIQYMEEIQRLFPVLPDLVPLKIDVSGWWNKTSLATASIRLSLYIRPLWRVKDMLAAVVTFSA